MPSTIHREIAAGQCFQPERNWAWFLRNLKVEPAVQARHYLGTILGWIGSYLSELAMPERLLRRYGNRKCDPAKRATSLRLG